MVTDPFEPVTPAEGLNPTVQLLPPPWLENVTDAPWTPKLTVKHVDPPGGTLDEHTVAEPPAP